MNLKVTDPMTGSRSLPSVAESSKELQTCGWRRKALDKRLGREVLFQTFQGAHRVPMQLFSGEGEARLLLMDMGAVTLNDPKELFCRFLNIPLEVRMALSVARLAGPVDWMLLRTANRVELYRLSSEVCEVAVTGAMEWEEELLPVLSSLARGRETGTLAPAQHLPGADSLRGWLRYWSQQLGVAMELKPADAGKIIWKWIVMLQLARRQKGGEAASGQWGVRWSKEDGVWTIGYEAHTATGELIQVLEAFDRTFSSELLGVGSVMEQICLEDFDELSTVDRFRAELLMHSQNRFEPETVAWLFTDLAREQEGWRREICGVEPIRKRIAHEGWNVYRPLVCDIARYGLTTALQDMTRLARYLFDQDQFMRQRQAGGSDQGDFLLQPDMFCATPRGVNERGELIDGFNFLLGNAMRLTEVAEADRFGVGVTFLLKALTLGPETGWKFKGIDTLDELFAPVE